VLPYSNRYCPFRALDIARNKTDNESSFKLKALKGRKRLGSGVALLNGSGVALLNGSGNALLNG
jgi:hypothetical protein